MQSVSGGLQASFSWREAISLITLSEQPDAKAKSGKSNALSKIFALIPVFSFYRPSGRLIDKQANYIDFIKEIFRASEAGKRERGFSVY